MLANWLATDVNKTLASLGKLVCFDIMNSSLDCGSRFFIDRKHIMAKGAFFLR